MITKEGAVSKGAAPFLLDMLTCGWRLFSPKLHKKGLDKVIKVPVQN